MSGPLTCENCGRDVTRLNRCPCGLSGCRLFDGVCDGCQLVIRRNATGWRREVKALNRELARLGGSAA